jgi:hypothetical protein
MCSLLVIRVNGKSSKSYPAARSGALRILSPQVRICLNIPCGLHPPEPAVPAIHPASKLAGILAKGKNRNKKTELFIDFNP